jgi:hypothetical protein
LDDFVAVTGFHRKHAMRVLRSNQTSHQRARLKRRVYDDNVREALILLWEASDRVCGKRLKPLIPVLVEAMERHRQRLTVPCGLFARKRVRIAGNLIRRLAHCKEMLARVTGERDMPADRFPM